MQVPCSLMQPCRVRHATDMRSGVPPHLLCGMSHVGGLPGSQRQLRAVSVPCGGRQAVRQAPQRRRAAPARSTLLQQRMMLLLLRPVVLLAARLQQRAGLVAAVLVPEIGRHVRHLAVQGRQLAEQAVQGLVGDSDTGQQRRVQGVNPQVRAVRQEAVACQLLHELGAAGGGGVQAWLLLGRQVLGPCCRHQQGGVLSTVG